jgi:hypothetical protein
MIAMAVIGAIAIVSIAAAASYDRRAQRRGARVSVSGTDIEKREASRWPSWVSDDDS